MATANIEDYIPDLGNDIQENSLPNNVIYHLLTEPIDVNKEQGFSSLDQIKGLHCLRERKFVVCIFVVCQSVTVMDVA